MFLGIVVLLFIISFVLALRALKFLDEKPKMGHVKKSLDKNRVIYDSRTSSSGE
jgi:hypothetical protein